MLAAGVIVNKINVNNFARCLCGVGKFEKACNIIHEMMHKGFIADTSTYSKVTAYLYGCAPNVVTYTALIHTYLKARKVSKADELFKMMLSKGCTPNVVTYTTLIDGHCKAGQIEKAYQIYTKMCTNAEIPDVELYFKVVDSNAKCIHIWSFSGWFMQGSQGRKARRRQKVFSKISEHDMIDSLCKASKTDEAYKLMLMMEEKGCYPNVVTYTAMIDGFGKAGKIEKSLELLEQMGSKGVALNFITYIERVRAYPITKWANGLDLAISHFTIVPM
ncbi:pentatricopeptide repeat-containing protein mitochondrial-like [Gossypium australe]|uniref:Pentatricopeptide repeat-containing protein mitochondrial-like n=1 Tax=Gossypium australe TaxID=47621 RepID=A0A5B6VDB4_9ROSI|nr:pentatricopeptide repeat-containing protein mitochondrial-like [Gossypium australe]